MQDFDIKEIALASVIGTSVSTVVTSGVLAFNPALGLTATLLSNLLSDGAKSFATKLLGKKEDERVSNSLMEIRKKIQTLLDSGKIPSCFAGVEENPDLKPDAKELLEGTLLKVRDEYINKKQILYSNFYANYCFRVDLNDYEANSILLLLQILNYHQLLMLAYLYPGKTIECSKWQAVFHRVPELNEYYHVYTDLISMYSQSIVCPLNSLMGITLGMPDITISPLGSKLVELCELHNLSDDIAKIEQSVQTINSIINNFNANQKQ